MIFKRPKSAVSNQHGFTFVELLTVIGILGILAAIALQATSQHKAKALDTKVIALVKNLLTTVAIEPPDPLTSTGGGGFGGNFNNIGHPQVEAPASVTWNIVNIDAVGTNRHDMWMFYLAHPKGKRGYYFWIPGNDCGATEDSVAGDGTGNPSDYIFYDEATGLGSYRNNAGV